MLSWLEAGQKALIQDDRGMAIPGLNDVATSQDDRAHHGLTVHAHAAGGARRI